MVIIRITSPLLDKLPLVFISLKSHWKQIFEVFVFLCGKQSVCVCAHMCVLCCFSRVQLFATSWAVARQVPLSMGFSRQEYWSVWPCPPPGDSPDLDIELGSLNISCICRQVLSTSATGKPGRQNNGFQMCPQPNAQTCEHIIACYFHDKKDFVNVTKGIHLEMRILSRNSV